MLLLGLKSTDECNGGRFLFTCLLLFCLELLSLLFFGCLFDIKHYKDRQSHSHLPSQHTLKVLRKNFLPRVGRGEGRRTIHLTSILSM